MGSTLRVGTCSWKYPSWNGLVYSKAAGIDYLSEYAARYDTVEVDQWFWALPEPAAAAQYASVTPDSFRFTVKLPNMLSLTHFYPKKGEPAPRPNPQFLSAPLFQDVVARLESLSPKIGMLMLQFEYLKKQKMASQEEFLRHLGRFFDTIPRSLPIAVEPRNPRWIDQRYFEFLAERGLSHVFLQGYYMPSIFETWQRFGGLVRDSMMRDMKDRSLTIYLNINNHFEGSAPLTIERLRERGLFDGV